MRALALVASFFFFASDAVADDEPETPPKVEKSWYGWQPLLCDASALTAFVIATETSSRDDSKNVLYLRREPAIAGATLFVACAPIVHLAHAHLARFFGDIAMRTAMTLSPLAIGYGIDQGSGTYADHSVDAAPPIFTFLGAYASVLVAAGVVAIDATIMSRDVKPRAAPASAFAIAPDVESMRGGGTLGVRGAF